MLFHSLLDRSLLISPLPNLALTYLSIFTCCLFMHILLLLVYIINTINYWGPRAIYSVFCLAFNRPFMVFFSSTETAFPPLMCYQANSIIASLPWWNFSYQSSWDSLEKKIWNFCIVLSQSWNYVIKLEKSKSNMGSCSKLKFTFD